MSGPIQHRQARRFAVSAPLLYREAGTSAWHRGASVNVSCSGALFRVGGCPPGVGQRLEFIFTLPLDGGGPEAHVRCSGKVVRIERSPLAAGSHAVAISIDGDALERALPA